MAQPASSSPDSPSSVRSLSPPFLPPTAGPHSSADPFLLRHGIKQEPDMAIPNPPGFHVIVATEHLKVPRLPRHPLFHLLHLRSHPSPCFRRFGSRRACAQAAATMIHPCFLSVRVKLLDRFVVSFSTPWCFSFMFLHSETSE